MEVGIGSKLYIIRDKEGSSLEISCSGSQIILAPNITIKVNGHTIKSDEKWTSNFKIDMQLVPKHLPTTDVIVASEG